MPPSSFPLYSPSRRVKLALPAPEDDEKMALFRTEDTTRKYVPFLPGPEEFTAKEAGLWREMRGRDKTILDLTVFVRVQRADSTVDPSRNAASPNPDSNADSEEYEIAGSVALKKIDEQNKSFEAGILVHSRFMRLGLATEALYTALTFMFEERGFHKVSFGTWLANEPMRGWLEGVAGVKLEGVMREQYSDGKGGYLDEGLYGLLEGEWRDEVKGRLEKRLDVWCREH